MFCSKCGAKNTTGAEFCYQCGSQLEASVAPEQVESADTSGSSSVEQDMNFCTNCGGQLPPGAKFCAQCGWSVRQSGKREAASIPSMVNVINPRLNASALIGGVGAILMLISLAVPWYAFRLFGESENISANDLLDAEGLNWFGVSFPVILIIIFASLALLGAIYSAFVGIRIHRLLYWFGLMSMACVLSNALYLLFEFHEYTSYWGGGEWVNIVHAGSIMVFIGSIAMIVGSKINQSEA